MNRYGMRRKKSNCDRSDMISNLPDFIIGRILSFLPTEEAVRTCVLSNRWIYMWKSITKVHFQDREPDYYGGRYHKKINKTHFLNFVNRVLLYLSSIEGFSLYLSLKYDPHRVNLWISDILNRGAKKLSIDSHSKKQLDISSYSLLKSRKLEKLVLKNACSIKFPNFLCLSSLAVLKLFRVTLTCDSRNLRLKLPVLRKYEMATCTWLNIKCVTFEVPLLEVLLISHYPYVDNIKCVTFEVPLLEVLLISHYPYVDESRTIIKFCASCLTEFSYRGYMLPDTILLDLDPSTARVASVNIDLREFKERKKETALLGYKFLKQFHSHLECLKFQRSEILEIVRDSLVADPFKFEMLSHLELGKVTGKILRMFLIRTPCLKTLILEELLQFEEELSDHEFVPSCFKSNLQVVYFGRLNGVQHELRFAKYVLENAQVLESANFSPTWELHHTNLEYVKEKIFSFKRSDRFAFMEFSSY